MTFLDQAVQIITLIGGTFTIFGVPFMIYTVYNINRTKDGDKVTDTEKKDLMIDSKIDLMKAEFAGAIKNLETSLGGEIRQLRDAWIDVKKNDLHSIYEKQKDQDQQYHNVALELREMRTIINLKLAAEAKEKTILPGSSEKSVVI